MITSGDTDSAVRYTGTICGGYFPSSAPISAPNLTSRAAADDSAQWHTHAFPWAPRDSPDVGSAGSDLAHASTTDWQLAGTKIKNNTHMCPQYTRRGAMHASYRPNSAGLYDTCTQVHPLVVGAKTWQ